jgi:hypothetical protein
MNPVIDFSVDDDTPEVEHHHDDITIDRPRRRWFRLAGVVVAVGLAGGGVWWHQAVTADPGLVFDGAPNVFATPQGGDMTGITRVENSLGTDVDVDYRADARLYGYFGLYNDGARTVTIEAIPPEGFYYWAFDGAAVSDNPHTALVGRDYTPFRPFTLRPGQTRYVRLDFRQATCDPAGLQDGSSRVDSLPVRYRVLGRTRTADVPFDQVTIAVKTTGICDRPL